MEVKINAIISNKTGYFDYRSTKKNPKKQQQQKKKKQQQQQQQQQKWSHEPFYIIFMC